jgi:hypothetical protein
MLIDFLRELSEHGRIRLPTPSIQDSATDARGVEQLLADWDSSWVLEFPGDAPPLFRPAARWAAEQLYRACQLAVFRDFSADDVKAAFANDCPTCDSASQHYSVDLVFRYLPDLYRIARARAEDDPLCEGLREWARRWPLSSVGMVGVTVDDVAAVTSHPGLLQLYVDRIISKNDKARLNNATVAIAVKAALGHFTELAPEMGAMVASYD